MKVQAETGVLLVAILAAVLTAGCGRESPPAAPAGGPSGAAVATPEPGSAPAPAAAGPAVSLADVVENDPRYVIGISYPASAASQPGLARALHDYAQAARGELMQAVEGLQEKPAAPYELSLGFRSVMESPEVIAIAADGSLYTGGAHGQPLVARFVWLPPQQEMLTSANLLASPAGWEPIAEYIGEQLDSAAHIRAADESLEPADRQRLLSVAMKMIDEGTEPRPESFSQFEPVKAADGRLSGLRFVFPPYQVGPYSDGVQYVEVPAAVLLPYVAPAYRGLFSP